MGYKLSYEMAENGTKWHGFGVFSGIFWCFEVRLISEGIVFSDLRFEALGGPWQKGCQNVLQPSFFKQSPCGSNSGPLLASRLKLSLPRNGLRVCGSVFGRGPATTEKGWGSAACSGVQLVDSRVSFAAPFLRGASCSR